ncbi:tyrosine-type recombinase/integrase [Duganella vulcania]|uniref:Site-specific integrase n=1 Tax=Duganella vulcania TaxID=2692166 RepID=A0A845GFH1_9BURK|nr:phage integrase N-terminal domain-containing protein [Duganella vulcania]MYM92691.1 site-specific integrase [Duganella vulcania]
MRNTSTASAAVPPIPPAGGKGDSWLLRLQRLVDRHAHLAKNGSRIASSGTKQARVARLKQCFRDLRELGYMLPDPAGLKPKHVVALVKHWEQKGLSAATIQNRVSVLRSLAQWIGKDGMVRDTVSYASSAERVRVTTSAVAPKTWSDNGVDIEAKLGEIARHDAFVWIQTCMALVFGLRRKEAVMMKPNRADRGDLLFVTDGTKGGRDRVVPIDSDIKRRTLDIAKMLVGPALNAHLGGPRNRTLQQALKRYDNVLYRCDVNHAKMKVSGHGLRHEYMNNRYEQITGELSPVRGGRRPPRALEAFARAVVAEEGGHTRTTIGSSYYGSHANLKKAATRAQANAVEDGARQQAPGSPEVAVAPRPDGREGGSEPAS